MVCIGSLAPQCRTVLQSRQDKTLIPSQKKRSIMEYPPGLPQDTKSLRSCSGNRAKMLLRGWNKMSLPIYQGRETPSAQFHQYLIRLPGDALCMTGALWCIAYWPRPFAMMHCAWPRNQFFPQRSHHSPTQPRSQIMESATVTLPPGDGTTAIKVESSA